jgi:hypothetical protein
MKVGISVDIGNAGADTDGDYSNKPFLSGDSYMLCCIVPTNNQKRITLLGQILEIMLHRIDNVYVVLFVGKKKQRGC